MNSCGMCPSACHYDAESCAVSASGHLQTHSVTLATHCEPARERVWGGGGGVAQATMHMTSYALPQHCLAKQLRRTSSRRHTHLSLVQSGALCKTPGGCQLPSWSQACNCGIRNLGGWV